MLKIRCIRCGGPHLVWQCVEPRPSDDRGDRGCSSSPVWDCPVPLERQEMRKFDKVAYMRAYMKKRREAARREGKRVD